MSYRRQWEKQKNARIFSILLVSYLIVAITLIGLSSVFLKDFGTNLSLGKTGNYTWEIINNANKEIEDTIRLSINTAFQIANKSQVRQMVKNYPELDTMEQVAMEKELKKAALSYWYMIDEVFNITFYLSGQKIKTSPANGIYAIEDVYEEDWFKPVENRTGNVSAPHPFIGIDLPGKLVERNMVLTALVTCTDEIVKKPAYVGVDVSINYLDQRYITANKISENSLVFLVDEDGVLIGGDWPNIETERKLGYKEPGFYDIDMVNGQKMLCIYTDQNSLGWRVIQFTPINELYIGKDTIQKSVFYLIIFGLIATGIMTLILAKVISKPIVAFSNFLTTTSGNEAYGTKKLFTSKEVNNLINSYNTLITQIHKENEKVRRAEIKALQSQINPHFLYNTLDCVNWMAIKYGIRDISVMVTKLSKLLRITLSKGESIYTLSEELEHVSLYLEMMKLMKKYSFTYKIDCSVEANKYMVPKLIIQPIVENSILHGFKKTDHNKEIIITTYIKKDNLMIDIYDNGVGINEDWDNIISEREGYGLGNVIDRIRYFCGVSYGLKHVETERGTLIKIQLDANKCENKSGE